jgi:hypothetical protein
MPVLTWLVCAGFNVDAYTGWLMKTTGKLYGNFLSEDLLEFTP